MRRGRIRSAGIPALFVAAVGVFLPAGADEKTPDVAIVYPLDHSAVSGDAVLIMAVARLSKKDAKILVDGKAVEVRVMPFDPEWLDEGARLIPRAARRTRGRLWRC